MRQKVLNHGEDFCEKSDDETYISESDMCTEYTPVGLNLVGQSTETNVTSTEYESFLLSVESNFDDDCVDSITEDCSDIMDTPVSKEWALGYFYADETDHFLKVLEELYWRTDVELKSLGLNPVVVRHNYNVMLDVTDSSQSVLDEFEGIHSVGCCSGSSCGLGQCKCRN